MQDIQAGGFTLANGPVSQLVQAMAAFSTANPGFDPGTPLTSLAGNPIFSDANVQSAVATAWNDPRAGQTS